jgi:hypothetical protein
LNGFPHSRRKSGFNGGGSRRNLRHLLVLVVEDGAGESSNLLSNLPLLGVYLEDGRLELTTISWKTPFDRPPSERTGCSSAMPRPVNAAPSSTPLLRVAAAVVFDPHAYLRDVLTRLPSMTNRQVKDITPEAWAKTSPFSAEGNRSVAGP